MNEQGVAKEQNSPETTGCNLFDWVPVGEMKPEIPKGKYGVSVLVTLHDPVYEEISPGNGSYTTNVLWDGETFKQLAYGNNDWMWVACVDIPTHWMYLPQPAPPPKVQQFK